MRAVRSVPHLTVTTTTTLSTVPRMEREKSTAANKPPADTGSRWRRRVRFMSRVSRVWPLSRVTMGADCHEDIAVTVFDP